MGNYVSDYFPSEPEAKLLISHPHPQIQLQTQQSQPQQSHDNGKNLDDLVKSDISTVKSWFNFSSEKSLYEPIPVTQARYDDTRDKRYAYGTIGRQ
jgi:hypothetical protein